MPIAMTDAIKTLAEAERRFGIARSEDLAFFPEWRSDELCEALKVLKRMGKVAIETM